mmetsp:Transcript_32601/g.55710  ORF Transcript_32601/g.55710 Transcript_32601/m.55710 type:complete len:216 (-) Transcript_32601:3005-3652(-)
MQQGLLNDRPQREIRLFVRFLRFGGFKQQRRRRCGRGSGRVGRGVGSRVVQRGGGSAMHTVRGFAQVGHGRGDKRHTGVATQSTFLTLLGCTLRVTRGLSGEIKVVVIIIPSAVGRFLGDFCSRRGGNSGKFVLGGRRTGLGGGQQRTSLARRHLGKLKLLVQLAQHQEQLVVVNAIANQQIAVLVIVHLVGRAHINRRRRSVEVRELEHFDQIG